MEEYSIDKALAYIKKSVTLPTDIDDSTLTHIIQLIWDAYDHLEMLDADFDDSDDDDTQAEIDMVTDYLLDNLTIDVSRQTVVDIVMAETKYEYSILDI